MSSRIEISSSEDLDKIRDNPHSKFTLVDDIDIGEWHHRFYPYLPDMVKDRFDFCNISPISNFGGEIDGNGHKIKNLRISTDFYDSVGLFEQNYGYIENLILENIYVRGTKYSGGLAGINEGKIENCQVSGTVKSSKPLNTGCGGIVGKGSEDSVIIGCEFEGTVSARKNAGGIIGDNYGLVKNCHSSGSTRSSCCSGGIVGRNSITSEVQESSSEVEVSGVSILGGLSGVNMGEIKDCYFQGDISKPFVDDENVGLIVGINKETLVNCYWETGIDEDLEPTGSNDFGKTKRVDSKKNLKEIESSIVANKI